MSDEQSKKQQLAAAEKLATEMAMGVGGFVKAAWNEIWRDRSGLAAYRKGTFRQKIGKGIEVSRAGIEQAVGQGVKISRAAIEPVFNQGLQIKREVAAQVQNLPQTAIDVANNISQSFKPEPVQTADAAFKEGMKMLDEFEQQQPEQATEVQPQVEEKDKKKEVAEEGLALEESAAKAELKEPAKVKDEVLFAQGQFIEGISKEDILAISELLTAKKGDQLKGDAAKGLTIEYNGEVLLTTDMDGKVVTDRTNDKDMLDKFSHREKSEIADFTAQLEELKEELKSEISKDAVDRESLENKAKGRVVDAQGTIENAANQTAVILPQSSPQVQQVLKDIDRKALEADSPGNRVENGKALEPNSPPLTGAAYAPMPASPNSPVLKPSIATLSYEDVSKFERLTKVASTAFIQNYQGDRESGSIEGRVQAPDGTIIERTAQKAALPNEAKGFDLAVTTPDGQRHEIASYDASAKQFTLKEGIIAAAPVLESVSASIDPEGKFEQKSVVPQMEEQQQEQVQAQGKEAVTVGGEDGR